MRIYFKTENFIDEHCMFNERTNCPISNGTMMTYQMSQLTELRSIMVQQVNFPLRQVACIYTSLLKHVGQSLIILFGCINCDTGISSVFAL